VRKARNFLRKKAERMIATTLIHAWIATQFFLLVYEKYECTDIQGLIYGMNGAEG